MTVQIKPLKGFKNYINGEHNTLSLLIKSDCKLQEHLSNAREKLLTSLTNIIDHYNSNSNYEVYFYHKLQVLNGRRSDFLKTRAYKTKLDSIKIDLNASLENLLRIAHGEFVSHFVNITILLNDEGLELSKAWFPFGHFLPFVARFGFSYQQKATTSNAMLKWKHPQKTKTSNKKP